MSNETAEIKNIRLRAKLLSEIRQAERQIAYNIENSAGTILRDVLDEKIKWKRPDTIELTKAEYEKLENYLKDVSKNEFWRQVKHLQSYYDEIQIKYEILSQL